MKRVGDCFQLCLSSPKLSSLTDQGLKGPKMWTRFPNIQIYSNRESKAFTCQQVHTNERGDFSKCIEIFILLLKAPCTNASVAARSRKCPKLGDKS